VFPAITGNHGSIICRVLMAMDYKPLRFIGDAVEVEFDSPPLFTKKPDCPDRFTWKSTVYQIVEKVGEWKDFVRRGRMARNMSTEHAAAAAGRGSWGVGRFYFRVVTDQGQVFDLYYDRSPKDAADRSGSWFLDRELIAVDPRSKSCGLGAVDAR
jgi:hypothetical protein